MKTTPEQDYSHFYTRCSSAPFYDFEYVFVCFAYFEYVFVSFVYVFTQETFTSSKSKMETIKEGVKYFQS